MALTLLTANNAQTVLAAGISASATTLTVNTGTGALFPSPVSGTSYFKLTLIDATTGQLTEIVHVTSRTGDTMTISRAQEGTTARAWSANDIAANMLTAGTIALLAPLDSPALTGTPTAPTATTGDNSTQIATTAFAQAIATAIVGSAPGSLNTLQKLAAAINNDPNYFTSVANAIAALLPKRGFTATDFIRIPDAANGLLIQWAFIAVPDGADGTDATAIYFSWKTAMTRPLAIFSGISGRIANRACNAAFNGSTGGKLIVKNQGTGLDTAAYVLAIGQE